MEVIGIFIIRRGCARSGWLRTVLLVRAGIHLHIRGRSSSTSGCGLCVWLWNSNRFSCFLVISIFEILKVRMKFDLSNLNVSSIMLGRVSGTPAWCMSTSFLAVRTGILGQFH